LKNQRCAPEKNKMLLWKDERNLGLSVHFRGRI
jgi:hypothetical protein